MEMYLKLLVFLSVCYTSSGHLERLTGLLMGAHHQIHNKVHEIAGSVLGGFNFNIEGHVHHTRPPVHQQPSNGQPENVVVIIEEGGQGNQGQNHPQKPYGPPQQNYNQPPNNGYHPNQEYQRPVNPYNDQRPYGQNNYQNNYNNGNPGLNHNTQNPYQHGQNGPGPNQNTQNPYQNGQTGQYPNQGFQGNQNQNGYGNNQANNGNGIPSQNGYGIPNSNVNNNKPNSNEYEVKNPEQSTPKPNFNDNYKPTETNYGQHNDAHNAENAHKETSDKTTKKPKDDGPLFVPLNDYTYGGDKITVNAPKRETGYTETGAKEDEFAIDIRVKEK
ncbi:uncharacterized protein [Choristoneura fumiferana]|uniref:uncharacterized protein n=1 Tax=Choristoneura fumiferana TaxID=7141 RepID=UPI003D15C0E8